MPSKLFTKNFVLLVAGQALSLFGNCILDFALSMYILEATGSAALFAGFLSVSLLPMILLSPLGGVLADRANKRNIMVFLDLASGVVVLFSALCLDRGNPLAVIGGTLVLLSVLGAFESPTVQASVPQILNGDNIIRGNAVVNQITALSTLVGPFAGSMLYTAFGLKPVMYAGVVCFFLTAFSECFLHIPALPQQESGSVLSIIREDLRSSARYIYRENTSILKTLLFVSLIAFFIQGAALIGLPYLVRNILGLSAAYYGAVESILGLAGLLGSLAAGAMVTRFRIRNLNRLVLAMGLFLFPIGVSFLLPAPVYLRYGVLLCFFALIQAFASFFSVFGLSVIQQLTPEHMLGKIMSFAATITLCAQPLSQMLYGAAFDGCAQAVYWVLIPTGLILCIAACAARQFFCRVEQQGGWASQRDPA